MESLAAEDWFKTRYIPRRDMRGFFFSSRRRHTRCLSDWSSDVCSSDLSWANRIREHFKGNKIHLCSIVNAKAGACSENCSFCAQSSHYQTGSPKYGFIEPEQIGRASCRERV